MSVRIKRTAAGWLAATGVLRLCGALKARATQRLLLLGYHRVVPLATDSPHSGDLELVSATPNEFAWQIEYLGRRFEPVSFAQIADSLDGGRPLPKRAVAITFDDGFADVHEHAFPVLQRARMPATVFVSTDYVERPRPFWFDLMAWLVMHAPPGAVRVPGRAPLPIDESESARRAAVVALLKWLKSCEERERHGAVAALCQQFPDATAMGATVLGRPLSWQQIREMAAAGIEFGSHTASHRCLTKLSHDELEHELVVSKARLEEHLGTFVTSLAYPFGGAAAFDDAVIAATRRAGYRVATSYIPGVNALRTANRFALRRQHVERATNRAYFEALVNAPEWFD